MPRFQARLAPAFTLGLGLSLVVLAGCRGNESLAVTEIVWDTWGVPHIYAKDNADVFRAFGWAQAKAHGNLILKLYAEARGRSAEYWTGDANLTNDRFIHTMGIPALAASWYQQQTPEYRTFLDAFAAGFNDYTVKNPGEIADSVKVVLPVTATDVLAHGIRVINFFFMFSEQVELPKTLRNGPGAGSNMWAIGPKRSASGKAMLLQNPHLGWQDLYLFFEAHMVSPDMDVYGSTLVGVPTLALAFNDYLGWSHTVNTQDAADVYRLTKRGAGYALDGEERAFDTTMTVLKLKQADGSVRADTLVLKRSVHGPVFEEDARTALAVRVAGLDDPKGSEQWWNMSRAKSLAEFEGIVKQLHIPFFNIIYADRDGHIYYFFGGKTPIRPRGDVETWRGPVRGDSSSLVWNAMLAYEQLPHVTDPPSGWLQNANDPPWTATWPLVFDPDSYPPYLAPRAMHFRAARSSLMAAEDSSITFDELIQYKHSSRMAMADRILPELVAKARATGDARARHAADVLERWDRGASADSRGAVLFVTWAEDYFGKAREKGFARPWRLDSALTTPAGLGDPNAAVAALSRAAASVEKSFGGIDVPWGDVMRLRFAGKDLPGNGAPGDPFGVFRTAYYLPDKDGKFTIWGGDTYYAAVEFSNPIRAKVLTAYGNATQPSSKHVGDQLELFAKQEMRDVWRDRKTVEAHVEGRDTLTVGGETAKR